jgi:peptidyl-prolyl cis-trans isomerase B (cyclophilin B)
MAASKFTEPKAALADVQKYTKAVIKTSKGDITVELYPKEAPLSVTNFVQLSKGGFYDGLTFHRVVPNFVVQGGDPDGTGRGGPGYTIPAEIEGNPHKHIEGALAWARLGDEANPQRRSSGSQFYITLAPTPFLDNGYTVFGKTTAGMDVVKKIAVGDKILKIEIQ